MINTNKIPGLRTFLALLEENIGAIKLTDDISSFIQLSKDVFNFRILNLMNLKEKNKYRQIKVGGNLNLNYRCNRGDIQSIREVWMEEVYRLPFNMKPKVVIDLGANIGLTSLYLANRYQCQTIVAVEPVAENVDLIRLNLNQNQFNVNVIQAIVASQDGIAYFSDTEESNIGRVSDSGRQVSAVTMSSLLSLTPDGRADLVKIDIEGSEQDIFTNNVEWLNNVGALIIEFHPDRVDYLALVSRIQAAGFFYYPPFQNTSDPSWKGATDAFVRKDWQIA